MRRYFNVMRIFFYIVEFGGEFSYLNKLLSFSPIPPLSLSSAAVASGGGCGARSSLLLPRCRRPKRTARTFKTSIACSTSTRPVESVSVVVLCIDVVFGRFGVVVGDVGARVSERGRRRGAAARVARGRSCAD
jgi:hypothetical protein